MKRTALLGAIGAVLIVATSARAAITDPVKIETGQLSGASTGTPSVRVFRGIPFAAPPTGENRWRAPQPAAKWEGVRKADAFGAPCIGNVGAGAVVVVVVAAAAVPAAHLVRRAPGAPGGAAGSRRRRLRRSRSPVRCRRRRSHLAARTACTPTSGPAPASRAIVVR